MKINNTQITTICDNIVKADYVDAIVNPTNNEMVGHSGLNGIIHQAAGENLWKACEKLGGCKTGEAKATDAYNLPCKYIIHTVGPIWKDGDLHVKEQLKTCYKNVLETAKGLHIRSIGFSSISTGKHGFPAKEAAAIAVEMVTDYVKKYPGTFEKLIWIVRNEDTKTAYDDAISEREGLENIVYNAHTVSIPLRSIDYEDYITYGSNIAEYYEAKGIENVYGIVRCIDKNGNLIKITIPAKNAEDSRNFYVERHIAKSLLIKAFPLCRLIDEDEKSKYQIGTVDSKMDFYMRQHGFNYLVNNAFTDIQRKNVLAAWVYRGYFSGKTILFYLDRYISKLKGPHFDSSIISNLEKDKVFVQDLMEQIEKFGK